MKKKNIKIKDNEIIEKVDEKEAFKTKLVLIISMLIPFFGPYIIYFSRISLPKRTKFILVQILNKSFTMSLIYLVLMMVSKNMLLKNGDAKMFENIWTFMFFLFVCSMLIQFIKSIQWLNGKDVKYKYILKLFKEEY
ncbi:hypothetical protein STFE110948_05315 [Streptobacillus felis]|uniref:DUF4870 domain-containing protein n=1 Tax=Streptobacillus felis TaxID=1384509 RepID=A0A7Z0PGI2_9FUSO|nr:hypothetical protein [Streptobacillus felis]NYV28278.1 hypothetical protein [Streptobacillus felis]